ncbi:MAG: hypothetical protein RL637_584 [Pseudomonadota bacterium]
MAKRIKSYTEVELIKLFKLQRLIGTVGEQEIFTAILEDAIQNIDSWHEEDLKMQFISFILRSGHLQNHPHYHPYFERVMSAVIEENLLKVKTDLPSIFWNDTVTIYSFATLMYYAWRCEK